jgi:phosphohistidine swiveling domain-containing protein
VDVVGIDIAAEEPESPDLVVNNYGPVDPDSAVDLIWNRLAAAERGSHRREPRVRFGTKAETLERLAPHLGNARVLPQIRFPVSRWQRDRAGVLARIARQPWGKGKLAVRSSARSEDMATGSGAGKYDSVLGVSGPAQTVRAIEKVIASFGSEDKRNQVFVQPQLCGVATAGVAFTRDPNGGGHYIVINYDDSSGRTDLVTSGESGELKTYIRLKGGPGTVPASLAPIVQMLGDLEELLDCDALDVEFAVDRGGALYLLQVRTLIVHAPSPLTISTLATAASEIACKIELLSRPHPYLHGDRSVFGVMPDWNPAEIIGLRPTPLAMTLYQDLVTDAIWAYQRHNYGYKDLRSFPLMTSFHGLPYIDLRVSFNSFVPRDVNGELAGRLVNYYIDRLLEQPRLHDKIEFEIVFSCYTLDLPERIAVLERHGFSKDDVATLTDSLRRLTNRIIHAETGLWRQDRDKIDILNSSRTTIHDAPIDKISRIYWLLEDCKRYGTLPFAGLARAGFIAVQLLHSLIATGVFDETECATFLANLETVGSRIGRDFASLSREQFLERYGHLRPGTYDILSPRYDEAPDLYFDWSAPRMAPPEVPRFALSLRQLRAIERLLKEHGIEHDVLGFMDFIKAGIEGREQAKFVFSRSLSAALSLIKRLGEEHGIPAEDCAMLDFASIRALYRETGSVAARLKDIVAEGKRRYALSRSLVLPPLLSSPEDVFGFHVPQTQPNFVTQKCVTAPSSWIADAPESLAGTVLFIPSADPGFDWIFTRGISGFVTQFGGANSHMAIRAGELGLPAVIGAGESLFQRWRGAQRLCLDCGNRQVRLIV